MARPAAAPPPASSWATARARERASPEEYVPYLGHASPAAVLLDGGGGLLGMLRLAGVAWETADADEVNARHARLNTVLRNVASERLSLSVIVARTHADPAAVGNADAALPADAGGGGGGGATFGRALAGAYAARLADRSLYENHTFLAVLRRPGGAAAATAAAGSAARWFGRRSAAAPSASAADLRAHEDVVAQLAADLAPYGPVRLGLREGPGGVAFSEVAEALRLALTGERLPVPLVAGHLGAAMYTDRAIVGREAVELRGPGGSSFAAVLSAREYPASTWPGQLDAFLSAPYRGTLVQTFGFLSKPGGHGVLTRKQNQMLGVGDKAASQREALADAADALQSNAFVMGDHHLSLMVLAESLPRLAEAAASARRDLAEAGVVVAREDLALEAAYWAQLPGNARLRARPGVITSRNFAALAPLHGYPAGAARGHWGAPAAVFRASGGTPYRFHLHVGDIGNAAVFGPTGSGKTTFLGFVLAMLAEGNGARVVFFDKDRGAEILARALGGTYLALPSGRPTGLAPLKALTADPADLGFLASWVRGLVSSQAGEGADAAGLSPEDERRIEQGLSAVMRLPPEARSLSELRAFLGQSDPAGAGARLERWCAGRALGWAFDGEADLVGIGGDGNAARFLGFDMTAVLDDPAVRGPAMAYLFHRVEALLDGSRVVVAIDEFWKALADPAFRGMVNDKLKTIRKLNGAVVLGTQSPRDALSSPIAHSLVEQCPTKVLMPNPRASAEDYRGGLKLTAPEFRMVREDLAACGGRGGFLLKQGVHSVACDLDLRGMDDFVAVLSGRRSTVALMERLREAHGPEPGEWLPHFMARWREAEA